MAHLRTLRTTAERANESTCLAFEDVLIDVFGAGPCEGTRVVTTQHVQGRFVRVRTLRTDHRHEEVLVQIKTSTLGSDVDGSLVNVVGSRVGTYPHSHHERSVSERITVGEQLEEVGREDTDVEDYFQT
jgi:hypothetical protein